MNNTYIYFRCENELYNPINPAPEATVRSPANLHFLYGLFALGAAQLLLEKRIMNNLARYAHALCW